MYNQKIIDGAGGLFFWSFDAFIISLLIWVSYVFLSSHSVEWLMRACSSAVDYAARVFHLH